MRTQPRLGTIGSMDATDDNEGRTMTIGVPDEVERTQVSAEREKVHFISGDTQCAAWHYPGTNGACVIMAGGFAVTMEPGIEPFAKRFNAAGFTVLAPTSSSAAVSSRTPSWPATRSPVSSSTRVLLGRVL
jgi:hypothetical protein